MERYSEASGYLDRAGNYPLLDIARIEEDAARLQAEVNAQVMGKLVDAIGRAFGWLGSSVARRVRDHWAGIAAGRLNGELARFSDSQLAKLGISRSDIPSYVASLVETPLLGDRPTVDSIRPALVASEPVEPAANEEAPSRRAA